MAFAMMFFLFLQDSVYASSDKVVVIDPGHGGDFSGTAGFSGNSTGYFEKDANLSVALKLEKILKRKGYTVFMTRDTDKDFGSSQQADLANRTEVANNFVEGNRDNSIFISIHHNASASPSYRGYETYYYDANDYNPKWPPDPLQIHYNSESSRLAHIIHNNVLEDAPVTEGRGILGRAFYVVRNAQVPSTLVEIGYMTNPQEEKLIKSDSFQQEIAGALAGGIVEYFGVYEIYDYKDKRIEIYESKNKAIEEAKALDNVYVLDKKTQKIIYSNIDYRYGVYHSSSDAINKLFVSSEKAIAHAKDWKNTRVVDNNTGNIIWSNYLDKNYVVEHSSQGELSKHYQLKPAIQYAKKWKNTAVVSQENGKVLWTNYLTRDYLVEHTSKGALADFYKQNIAIDYAKNWKNTTVKNERNNEIVFSNIDENYNYSFKTDKVSSDHRITTAVEVSENLYPNGFPSNHSNKTVILSTAYNYADALSSAPLAAQMGNAPILLTKTDKIRKEVLAELQRLKAQKVVIIGGTNAVSTSVEGKLTRLGYNVSRISGANRIATNQEINSKLNNVQGIIVASSRSFPDSLGVAPIAAIKNWAIVLTDSDEISKGSLNYLNFNEVAIVGGTEVVSNNVEQTIINQNGADSVVRLSGSDRYKTLASVLNYFADDIHSNVVLAATGTNFPDALTASSLSVKTNAPLILVGKTLDEDLSKVVQQYGDANVVERFKVIGGVLSNQTINNLTNLLK